MKLTPIRDLKFSKPHYPYRVVGYLPPNLYQGMLWLLNNRYMSLTSQIRHAVAEYLARQLPTDVYRQIVSDHEQASTHSAGHRS
ncbi:MAG: hypothetical protein RMN24_00705 [Anaerolineae bacterium]|nr:hypothetical protein [Anaerolineae bacterium]